MLRRLATRRNNTIRTTQYRPHINLNNQSKLVNGISSQLLRSYCEPAVKLDIKKVKELRDITKAGVKDCRDALLASNNDVEAATTWLLGKHAQVAGKKSGRIALEGGVIVTKRDDKHLIMEFNCETDFGVQDIFTDVAQTVSETILDQDAYGKTAEELLELQPAGQEKNINGIIEELSYQLRENVNVRRYQQFPTQPNEKAHIYQYVHNSRFTNKGGHSFGQTGVLIEIEPEAELDQKQKSALDDFGPKLCMQIAAYGPKKIAPEQEGEKEIDETTG
eukprot:TRINITY_DN2177_c0_g1_i2.p1 TRINITY_DN2177_c0_g1~~TRINITY_DN2177_c0_g1_i2.p1  ORF type:complete len:277 (-),score=74.87 TRINITY_DN2177_c0_g1_i2:149-979(-)